MKKTTGGVHFEQVMKAIIWNNLEIPCGISHTPSNCGLGANFRCDPIHYNGM